MTPSCFNRVFPFVWLAAVVALPGSKAGAQGITVDGRLSPAQTLAGPNYAIGAGLGRQVGGNLFHSFGTFGLKGGETATFSGPASVGNVIGRVTGGTASSINGGINSTIPGANLYLINPAGVVFGPNATVNVSGSFHASSADYLRMKDGARFQATNPDASTLSAAPPEAFGFLSANPRPITVNGSTLQLPSGGTLGLVGGDVTISGGTLSARAGTVHISSAAGPGEVPVDPRAGPPPTVARSGSVQVANASTIYPQGGSVFIHAGDLSVSATSTIVTNNDIPRPSGVLSLHGDRTVTISDKAVVVASATGTGRGPGISIGTAAGGTVTVDSATVATNAPASGHGGSVSISTGTLTLQNGAVVVSNANSSGHGGPISVAADSVRLDGPGTMIQSQTDGTKLVATNNVLAPAGAGGTISLGGGTLSVQNRALIEANTSSSGTAGSIGIAMTGDAAVTTGAQVLSNSNISSTATAAKVGDARTITLGAGTLTLARGGSVSSMAHASGNAGEVTLNIGGALSIDGTGKGDFLNGVSSEAVVGVSGSAGGVRVTAGSVSVLNGGFISSDTYGTGRGGPVMVTTPGDLVLDGGGGGFTDIAASAQGLQSGDAGTVSVSAGTVAVRGGAQIASLTNGPGRAGNVTVSTGALTLARGGTITTDTFGSGNAGDIALTIGGALIIDGTGKGKFRNGVSSEAGVDMSGTAVRVSGSAGGVQVSAGSVSVLNGGFINSNTGGTGRGGSVMVTTPGALVLDGGGGGFTEIGASALGPQSGDADTVTIHAGTVAVQGGAQIASVTNGTGRGGSIDVTAGALTLSGGGTITTNTSGSGNGGEIALTVGGALTIDGANKGNFNNGVSSEAAVNVSGSAGSVRVSAGSVSVLNGSFINSNTFGTGRGGSVAVDSGAVTLVHGGTISSATYGPGNAGEVAVNVGGALLLDDQGAGSTGIAAVAVGPQSGNAGTVTITAGTVAVQGGAQVASSTGGPGQGGGVTVNTGALAVLSAGNIASSTSGPGNAGEVTLNVGGPLTIDGTGGGRFGTGVSSEAAPGSSGSAGTIRASAGSVSIFNSGLMSSSTRGTGAGGSVVVTTPGALLLDGQGSDASNGITAAATRPESGAAGSVTVSAGTVTIQGGMEIASSTISAGRGGGVTVDTGALTISSAGNIASSTSGPGNAGEVTLNVGGRLTIDGAGGGRFGAGVSSEAALGSSGSAGTIRVRAGSVSVLNDAAISSSTKGTGAGGSVVVTTPGALLLDGQSVNNGNGIAASAIGPQSGAAGPVTVSAGTITVQGGAQISSSTAGPGQGGDVSVTAGSAMRLNGPGPQVNATATGAGAAGSITAAAPQFFLREGASISTASQSANGGNITVGPGDLLYLQRSSITTSVSGVSGNGGNITVEPRLVVLDRSAIQANAVGGNGGNVLVQANQLVQSAGSAITASSQRGVSGEIFVAAQPLNLNGSLVVLASELRSAAALLREGCAVRGASPRSSLIAAGRGGQRQGLEATLPALYFANRPVHDGAAPAADPPAAPQRISLGLSSTCG
jgi:filamentous hemagglutinin family protein